MAAEAGAQVRAGIGTRLRAAREKKGLTILQTAEKLHVDPRIVEALEAEDFAALGAAVYARGHLRHYAELVGEPVAELQELYSNATRGTPAQPDLTRISRPPPDPDSGKLAGPAVVVLVVIAAVGTVWWLMSHPTEKAVPAVVQIPPPVIIAPGHEDASPSTQGGATAAGGTNMAGEPAAVMAAATSRPSARNTEGPQRAGAQGRQSARAQGPQSASTQLPRSAGAQAPQSASTQLPRSAGAQAPQSPSAQGPVSRGATTNATAANPSAPAATARLASLSTSPAVAPPTTRGKEGQLTLKFSSDSWAEIYDASGQRLFYDVGAASSAHTVKGLAPLRVVLGNAAGVTLEFNGRATPVPTSTSADGSVRFIINTHGRAVPASNGE